jgi:predicted negative regulator of RcsB-dependent stress response
MATYDLDEQEKIDALKAWWKQHGNSVILAVSVFAATLVGVQGWRQYQASQAVKASMAYDALQNLAKGDDVKKVRDTAGQIIDQYSGTAYAPRAALIAAKANHEAGDMQSARAQLQWASEHAEEDAVRDTARLRLAGVLLDEKNYGEALKQVELTPSPAFAALFADMKGDILVAQGKPAEARSAYKTALETIGDKSLYRQVIKIKMESVGS